MDTPQLPPGSGGPVPCLVLSADGQHTFIPIAESRAVPIEIFFSNMKSRLGGASDHQTHSET
jgi:hypothetical protein